METEDTQGCAGTERRSFQATVAANWSHPGPALLRDTDTAGQQSRATCHSTGHQGLGSSPRPLACTGLQSLHSPPTTVPALLIFISGPLCAHFPSDSSVESDVHRLLPLYRPNSPRSTQPLHDSQGSVHSLCTPRSAEQSSTHHCPRHFSGPLNFRVSVPLLLLSPPHPPECGVSGVPTTRPNGLPAGVHLPVSRRFRPACVLRSDQLFLHPQF